MSPLPAVVLYARAGCHLCDDVLAALERLRARLPHELRVVDIDSDPALVARYRHAIPVLVVNGREYAAPLTPSTIEQALRASMRPLHAEHAG